MPALCSVACSGLSAAAKVTVIVAAANALETPACQHASIQAAQHPSIPAEAARHGTRGCPVNRVLFPFPPSSRFPPPVAVSNLPLPFSSFAYGTPFDLFSFFFVRPTSTCLGVAGPISITQAQRQRFHRESSKKKLKSRIILFRQYQTGYEVWGHTPGFWTKQQAGCAHRTCPKNKTATQETRPLPIRSQQLCTTYLIAEEKKRGFGYKITPRQPVQISQNCVITLTYLFRSPERTQ
jgi:hypothetical protein